MRVLVTVPWAEPLGGAETMLEGLLDGASEEGHEVELVFLERGTWPARLRARGIHVEEIEAGRLRDVRRFTATILALARTMRARRPEVILNWAAKTQLYGAPAALLAGMGDRVIWWQHSIPDRGWMDRAATRLPSIAVGCTSAAAAHAQQRLRPERRTFVVAAGAPEPSPVEEAASSPGGALPREPGVPLVGLVGRLQPWKGQDRLLRAHALLKEQGQRLHTAIVGGDAYGLSSEYAASLPGLVGELGLEGEVTFTGQVPDAGPYISQLDVLVNASEAEPFGIVLLEGMARGVAVVAVGSGGPSEFVEDGRTGALASSGSPQALAAALDPLLRSAELRASLGGAGRESYEREFTEAAMRKRFFASLQEVLDGSGERTGGVGPR
jgi:glycosyltransferase involved in cell wall biosynthesis